MKMNQSMSYMRYLSLVVLLLVSFVSFGQAPSNYVNINGRYRWIAGMFDSTFHIPKGSTPSLRTGGSTNSGGLFYNTSDSSVYTYTGTQWIKLRGSINPSDTTNKYVTQVYKKNASDSVFYVKGGNHLFAFIDSVGSPGGGGGGKVYYFNGGVSMGTFGGFTMYELGDTANTGAAANFTRATTGNIANFITDVNKPGLLQIPAGVWSVDAWLSETGGGANHAEIYVKVEKWDGTSISTIATSPVEQITEGNSPNLYTWSVSIPTTTLAVTDRIILQFYIQNTNGKTVTLYTQNGYVGEVHTTFTTGIGAINGLTAPAQYLVTGTSGTDFNINSSTATHTFNLPTASATNRGALSTTDWSTFNNKIGGSLVSGYLTKATAQRTIDTSQIYQSNGKIGIGRINPTAKVDVYDSLGTSVKSTMRSQINTDVALDVKTIGNRGYALIVEQADSSASGTQYQTIFRKSMMPGTGNPAPGAGVSWFTQISNDNNNNPAVSVYRARIIDSTGYASGLIKQTSTEFWSRKNNVWDTTLVLNGGNVGINTGQNGIDSALTVANGTWLKRGVRMSALPTGVGTKAVRIDANGTLSVADTLANGISGTGTTNYIPKFTSSSAIGNSNIQDNGSTVSIATGSTVLSLDRTGGATALLELKTGGTVRGYLGADVNTPFIFFNGSAAEQMRLTSGGLLGIGTSAPSTKLHISNAANGNIALFTNTNDADLFINLSSGVTSLSPSTGILAFGTSSTERMRLDASGNLGIATSSPGAKLEISTGGLSNGGLRLRQGSYNYWDITSAYATTNADLIFYMTGSEKMRIDASGNLGLGVTPSAWGSSWKALDISSVSSLASQSTVTRLYHNGYNDGSSNLYKTSAAASMYSQDAGAHQWFNAPSGTAGNAISFTQAMTLFSTGNLAVGGTSDAGYRLDVTGQGRFSGNVAINGTLIGTDQTFGGAYRTFAFGTNLNGYNRIFATNDASDGLYLNAATGQGIYFRVNGGGANVVSIASTGAATFSSSVTAGGIVSSATEFRLNNQTYSRVATLGSGGDFGGGYNFNWVNGSPVHAEIGSISGYGYGNDGSVRFYANSSQSAGVAASERMRITSGGNVGIGTTNPGQKLVVANTSADVVAQLIASSSGSSNIYFADGTTGDENYIGFLQYDHSSNSLRVGTSGNERMRLTSSGELLINTTSDAGDYKLQVNGQTYLAGSSGTPVALAIASANSNADITLQSASSAGVARIRNGVNDLQFHTNGSLALTLTSAQNAEFASSIKTAAPSGGTAKPWKLGQAGVSVGGANTTAVAVEIDGTVYYLLTAYLPEPEPDPAALPSSGPSASYKPYNKPIPVKTTKDVEIENLRKEIEELKQLIKNK